jgi:Tfp pilus assembly protein PilV
MKLGQLRFNNMRGQTLIETLVALAVGVVVVSAITVISVTTLSNAQYVRSQENATKYAQEGIEMMRKIRNSSYAGFRSYTASSYCLDEGATTLTTTGPCTTPNILETFIRTVQITQNGCGANISRVTVTVSYRTGKCASNTYCHSSRLVSCLSTVNPVSAP